MYAYASNFDASVIRVSKMLETNWAEMFVRPMNQVARENFSVGLLRRKAVDFRIKGVFIMA